MTATAVEEAASAPDESRDGQCLYDQDWRFVLSMDIAAAIGVGAGAGLGDVRAALAAIASAGPQSALVSWLTRRSARLLSWALLWSADRPPGPRDDGQPVIQAARDLLTLLMDVAVTDNDKDAAELWAEAWKAMRALVDHVAWPTWLDETAAALGLPLTAAVRDEVGAAFRSELLPVWAVVVGHGRRKVLELPADLQLPAQLVARRLAERLKRAREARGDELDWTRVDELLAAADYLTTDEERARLASEIASACAAWARAKRELPSWAIEHLELAVKKLPGSFSLYRQKRGRRARPFAQSTVSA